MKKLLLVLAVSLSMVSMNAHAGRMLKGLLLGGVAGAVAGYALAPKEKVVQAPPDIPVTERSTIMCSSSDGARCGWSFQKNVLTIGQFVAQAGFKKYYKTTTIPNPNGGCYHIQIEVSN
jgi:hypothetical protein